MTLNVQFVATTIDGRTLKANSDHLNREMNKLKEKGGVFRPDISPLLITGSLDCEKKDIKGLKFLHIKGTDWLHLRRLPNLERVEFTKNIALKELVVSLTSKQKVMIVNAPNTLTRLNANRYSTITNLNEVLEYNPDCHISLG